MKKLSDKEYEVLALNIILDIDHDIYQDCLYDIKNDFHNIILDDTVHNLKQFHVKYFKGNEGR